jgi:pimeloyl-ACP methyl ester carboxylesterase
MSPDDRVYWSEERYGGLAADSVGVADERPPLVLLHGMTFDRTMWRPTYPLLNDIDPGRRIVALDLPGHGDTPDRASNRMLETIVAIHEAVQEAALSAPVLVGHSMCGGLASMYATLYPCRGVVNVDSPPELAPFAEMIQHNADGLRGPAFPAIWASIAAGFHAELLPPEGRELVQRTSRPRQELVLTYWQDMFETDPADLTGLLDASTARLRERNVPYLLLLGSPLPPRIRQWMAGAMPSADIREWPDSSHFPHLAHPARFAELLTETAGWVAPDPN